VGEAAGHAECLAVMGLVDTEGAWQFIELASRVAAMRPAVPSPEADDGVDHLRVQDPVLDQGHESLTVSPTSPLASSNRLLLSPLAHRSPPSAISLRVPAADRRICLASSPYPAGRSVNSSWVRLRASRRMCRASSFWWGKVGLVSSIVFSGAGTPLVSAGGWSLGGCGALLPSPGLLT